MPKKFKIHLVKTIIPNSHLRYHLQSVLQELQQQQIHCLHLKMDQKTQLSAGSGIY